MKFLRLATLICFSTSLSFGASKEVVELQRDVALLQDQVRQVQRTLDEKLAQLTLLMQQTQDNSNKANNSLANVQTAVGDTLSQQLRPVTQLGSKVDGLGEDIHGIRDSVNDLNSRMAKLDAKITDITNRMSIMQNPPSAPGASAPGGVPGQPAGAQGGAAPPQGMSAETAWQSAEHDRLSGNFDLALKEYQDYLTYYPNTDYAPSAQYEIGEVYYNKGDYDNALKAFDAVVERFPDNPKTKGAHYMKGQTLLRTGDRNSAAKEFKYIVSNYPGTEEARRAAQSLKGLGIAASGKPSPARRR
jgi:tol-pal system protein YbgF